MFPSNSQILIVDDVKTMRQIAAEILRRAGYRHVSEARDGEVAFERIIDRQRTTLPIDLVIADWHMPVMDGLELLRKIRATKEVMYMPFIICTSENETNRVVEAVVSGVSDYIIKPIKAEVLTEKLRAVWQKHYPDKV